MHEHDVQDYYYYYTRLTASFPEQPGQSGTRKVKPVWIEMRQEMMGFWDVVASAGPYANSLWVRGDLRIFQRNVLWRRLTVLQKNILGYLYVDPFGYVNAPDEGTVKIWGNFPISPKMGGQGEESNHRILISPPAATQAIHSLVLRSKG